MSTTIITASVLIALERIKTFTLKTQGREKSPEAKDPFNNCKIYYLHTMNAILTSL